VPRKDGIDVSRFQHPPYQAKPVDWEAVKNAGVWWVAYQTIKGDSVDPSFAYNRSECARLSIPADAPAGTLGFRYRLAYGYPTTPHSPNQATNTPWDQQARNFVSAVGRLLSGEGVMCDAETEGISEQLTLLWCQTVEVATKLPVAVYTGGYVAGGTLWRSSSIYNGQRARVFAAYSSESDARNKHAAGIPWDAWQFSGTGACPGVLGDCDLDQVDDAAAFKLTCGLTGETEQEMPFFMNWKHRAT